MRDYQGIANLLIKNRRWWRVRKKVRQALERAYQDGLNDAIDKVTASASELSDSIRGLGREGTRPALPPPIPHVTH